MKTTLQIPIDKNLKKTSEVVAEEYGFSSLQELVRVFLKQVSTKKIVPYFATNDQFLTNEEEYVLTQKYLKAKKDIKFGNGFVANSAEEMIKQLDS